MLVWCVRIATDKSWEVDLPSVIVEEVPACSVFLYDGLEENLMEPVPLVDKCDIWVVGAFVPRVPIVKAIQSCSDTIESRTPHIPDVIVVHILENKP
jgi:hypothetical protein